ncbi:hypothetical protein L2E82_47142 [Cichorium intybus]|uniref:Uncharacterized protein n=1 Tax=Cichorium intybus TaxID=13427 RepID=A0ACB8YUJ1_CICIN|nr:hypothetical protein L2E82_47142 [Cichorium intybus]
MTTTPNPTLIYSPKPSIIFTKNQFYICSNSFILSSSLRNILLYTVDDDELLTVLPSSVQNRPGRLSMSLERDLRRCCGDGGGCYHRRRGWCLACAIERALATDERTLRSLEDSLGGSCNTVMIANISPSNLSFGETQNTLQWADRAKEIHSKVGGVVKIDDMVDGVGVAAANDCA